MTLGYLALVLHAHLPFVRHPERDYVLEEEWLYEAITETYIPLLQKLELLKQDGVEFKLTMSLTPPLIAMLKDEYLQHEYDQYLSKLEELTQLEIKRNQNHQHLKYLAEYYEQEFASIRTTWEKYQGDLVTAFKNFQDSNNLDIITCGATHGYLPLMNLYPSAVKAQVQVACEDYEYHFGMPPKGIWLPECAYYEGLEQTIAQAGLRYFVMDAHGIDYTRPRPKFGTYAPIITETGVAIFGRDNESSQQVWSADVGYPGDGVYREFYKDLGWEADYEYIKPYIMPNGERKNVGIKYHKITSRQATLQDKELYDPYWAKEKAAEHAGNFLFNRCLQIEHLVSVMGRQPIVVSPYDAELYGHWWYEGPQFLDFLFRKAWFDQDKITLTHLADYLQQHQTHQLATPAQSSWGYQGFHKYWLNETNNWIYPHLHQATEKMIELANREPEDELELKALNQMARELLLAQSSDWAFIMRTGTMVPYAVKRTKTHLLRFKRLSEEILAGKIDGGWLNKVEAIDNIFPFLDYRVYRTTDKDNQ
jgi:1,4-alpha-glucan branching enzyme